MYLLAIGEGVAVGRGDAFLFPVKGEFGQMKWGLK